MTNVYTGGMATDIATARLDKEEQELVEFIQRVRGLPNRSDVIRLALRTLGQETHLLEAREQFLANWLAETDRTLTDDAVEAMAQKYDL